jgi:hypothetical protein
MNYVLIAGAAVAAWFIFTSMKKRRGSSVEAGSPIKQTEGEFEAEYAEVVKPSGSGLTDTTKSILDVFKSLKRTPEQKASAQAKKSARKSVKAQKRSLKKKKVSGFDDMIGLY